MSIIGLATSVNASSVLDKEQNVQQMQVDVNQAQVGARLLREQNRHRKSVTNTHKSENVRLGRRREEEYKEGSRERKADDVKQGQAGEEDGAGQIEDYKQIDLTI